MTTMLNIALFGPPGAGKGTQAKKIVEKYKLAHLSTGDMIRKEIAAGSDFGKMAADIINRGELLSDKFVVALIENSISQIKDVNGFLFDGFPRTVEQAKILDEMFPSTEEMSDREKRNAEKAREEYMICYFRPDIAQFLGTAWGALNAMSDMVGHSAPRRMTSNYQENNWGRIMDGHAMMDKMASLLAGIGA